MGAVAKIVVVGLDAVDKDILRDMARDGRLPTVASFLDAGAWAETINPPGLFVGALWASFLTGVSAAKHGRHAANHLVPGTYEIRRSSPREIRRPPFWAALSAAGRRVAVIDVPHTFALPGLNGVQVVEWGGHDPALGFHTSPLELADDLVGRFGHHPVNSSPAGCDRPRRTADDYVALRAALVEGATRKGELCRHLLERGGWDLFLAVFGESHCAVHHSWHLRDAAHPRHDPETARRAGDTLEQVYIALDRALGRLLAMVDENTTVLVLASHGAGPHYDGSFLLDRVLRRLEEKRLPRVSRWTRAAFVWAWQRASDRLRRRHPHFRDRLWAGWESLPPLDPGGRRCFKVDNNEPYGGIRVNLAGREPRGKVRPDELDAFCVTLATDLLAIINLETGRPLARRVLRTADLYEGEHLDMLPDLLVEWDWEAPVRSIASPKLGRVELEYTGGRTGDHRPAGLLLARGPGIPSGRIEPIEVIDLAPTIAALLGVDLHGVDGRPVSRLIGTS